MDGGIERIPDRSANRARVSELTGLRCQDVVLGAGAHGTDTAKEQERCTPLRPGSGSGLTALACERQGGPGDRYFPNARGSALIRMGWRTCGPTQATATAACAHRCSVSAVYPMSCGIRPQECYPTGLARAVIALGLDMNRYETTSAIFMPV